MERASASNALCPRCGAAFRCGVADAAPCPCMTVKLDDTTLAGWRDQFTGCLCMACLANGARPTPAPPDRIG